MARRTILLVEMLCEWFQFTRIDCRVETYTMYVNALSITENFSISTQTGNRWSHELIPNAIDVGES